MDERDVSAFFSGNPALEAYTVAEELGDSADAEAAAQLAQLAPTYGVMACHPTFLTRFHALYSALMRDDGALPLCYRNYIAIIASARHDAAESVRAQSAEFELNGGEPAWLEAAAAWAQTRAKREHAERDHKQKAMAAVATAAAEDTVTGGGGTEAALEAAVDSAGEAEVPPRVSSAVPRKLAALGELNAILCHQPWKLTKEHVQRLMEPKSLARLAKSAIAGTAGQGSSDSVSTSGDADRDRFEDEESADAGGDGNDSGGDGSCGGGEGLDNKDSEGISEAHGAAATSSDDGEMPAADGDDAWSVTELVAAIFVLSTHHALASFTFGSGVLAAQRRGEHERTAAIDVANSDSDRCSGAANVSGGVGGGSGSSSRALNDDGYSGSTESSASMVGSASASVTAGAPASLSSRATPVAIQSDGAPSSSTPLTMARTNPTTTGTDRDGDAGVVSAESAMEHSQQAQREDSSASANTGENDSRATQVVDVIDAEAVAQSGVEGAGEDGAAAVRQAAQVRVVSGTLPPPPPSAAQPQTLSRASTSTSIGSAHADSDSGRNSSSPEQHGRQQKQRGFYHGWLSSRLQDVEWRDELGEDEDDGGTSGFIGAEDSSSMPSMPDAKALHVVAYDADAYAAALCAGFRADPVKPPYAVAYENFDVRSAEYRTYHTSDFDWKEQGFALAERFAPNLAPLFDELFDHAFDLTYNTLGGFADHDTSPFRHSVWYYTLRLYGIHYDDYNYGEINKICPRPMKEFIKMVACYPQVIKQEHFVSIAREMSFKDSEMVHICLLVMEARTQATLLYGLRCILSVMRPKE
eukprot:g2396.t1